MLPLWPHPAARWARWISKAADGDAKAFRALYRAMHPVVHAYVARRVATGADVEELVARVFHRAVENLARYDATKGSARAWLVAMARNAVIDHLRTRRELTTLDDAADLLVVRDPEPGDRDPRLDALALAITGLPAPTREMIALHFADGLTYREIAALMDSSEAAVKQRMARAFRELRAGVGEDVATKEATVHAV